MIRRPGFTLLELLVVVGIVAVVAALLVPAIQNLRESANRAACVNNLHQLGIALVQYQDRNGIFPIDDTDTPPSRLGTIFTSLLPFIEEQNNSPQVGNPVGLFLCPSRRGTKAGPGDDYGAGHHPDWWWEFYSYQGWYSILGGPYFSDHHNGFFANYTGVSLSDVVNHDGVSNTLMLAHKGLAPAYYSLGSSPPAQKNPALTTDTNWFSGGGWEHHRDPTQGFHQDNERVPNMQDLIGSPHRGSMPCLFTDGSVRSIQYNLDPVIGARLWAYNDGQPIPDLGSEP